MPAHRTVLYVSEELASEDVSSRELANGDIFIED
jgi:hypothetical protein